MSWGRSCAALISAFLVLSQPLLAADEPPQADPVASLPPIAPGRLGLILLESVSRSDSIWYQFDVGGTVYDARKETIVGRWSPGFQVGKRFTRWGLFMNFEIDRNYDLTQETRVLDVLHIGPGVEFMQFLGHVRSSVSAGVAVLRTDTEIDTHGKAGWFVDFRPASLRWAWGERGVIEFTPFSMDVSVPVTRGIPLILFSYFTVVSVEWAEEAHPDVVP